MTRDRRIAVLVLVASLLGLVFAAYSTYDYAAHLDRQMHAIHCSFIPGAPAGGEDNACKTALFSPYSALFRATWWGGVPISLFAVGAFCFFLGFGVYLLLAKERVPRIAYGFLGVVGVSPLLASLVMFTISAVKLGVFCKLCVGIYVSSILLAVGSVMALLEFLRAPKAAPAPAHPQAAPYGSAMAQVAAPAPQRAGGSPVLAFAWLGALGAASLLPALVYVASLPDYAPFVAKCGTQKLEGKTQGVLVKIPTAAPVQQATLFEDPLCPTCKGFHQRLVADEVLEKLDITLVLFPLDTECNWMIDRSLHPGACLLSGAVICSEDKARAMLEWSYDHQEELTAAGKAGGDALKKKISEKWGADLATCAADKKTQARVNQNLHYASNNHVPISTPQMFLGDRRVCEEDTDLGLKYTLSQLAPATVK